MFRIPGFLRRHYNSNTVVFRGKRGREKRYHVRRLQEYQNNSITIFDTNFNVLYLLILFIYRTDEMTYIHLGETKKF